MRGLSLAPSARTAVAPAVIEARSVSKRFRLPGERQSTVKDQILHPLRGRSAAMLPAVRDVSFDVREGEFVAIVGRNGSGKSTLLRCIAGIYPLDSGRIDVSGRIAPFIELGVGFHPELPARDNLITSGMLFGLSGRQIRRRYDEILDFAGVGEFAGLKLKNYSSGMTVRLAFALTTHIDADIMLFDEVIAIGDLAFQEKCLARFEELRAAGRTLVLVTHDMELVRRLCDRALLLERGALVCEGHPDVVTEQYDKLNVGPSRSPAVPRQARVRRLHAARTPEQERPPPISRRRRLANVTGRLAVVDFKLKYRDRGLSYLWGLLRPLLIFAALYTVFTRVTHFDRGVPHYGLYLLASLVLWTFFLDATTSAVFSLVNRADVIRKLPLPLPAVPLSMVLRSLFDLGLNVGAVLVFVAIAGVAPRLAWLELPLLIAMLTALAAGVALLMSALYVRLRDADQMWAVAAQVLFYCSPIVYVATALPVWLREPMFAVNPLATVFTEMRRVLVDPHAPSAAEMAGGAAHLLIPAGLTVATLALGIIVFARTSAYAAENL